MQFVGLLFFIGVFLTELLVMSFFPFIIHNTEKILTTILHAIALFELLWGHKCHALMMFLLTPTLWSTEVEASSTWPSSTA